jgi:hypothetical protein
VTRVRANHQESCPHGGRTPLECDPCEVGRLVAGIEAEAARCERIAAALDRGAGYGATRGERLRSAARRLRALAESSGTGTGV